MSRIPEISVKLNPARSIVDALNEHLRVDDYYFGMDDGYLEVSLRDASCELPDAANFALGELAFSLMAKANDLLPDGFTIMVQDGQFVLKRSESTMTEEEETEALRAAGELPDADPIAIPFCYRIPAMCGMAQDDKGNPVVFFGHIRMYFYDGQPDDIELAKKRRDGREWVANSCLINVEDVIPISLEEYQAAGYSVEG